MVILSWTCFVLGLACGVFATVAFIAPRTYTTEDHLYLPHLFRISTVLLIASIAARILATK